jgi:hypothetical protein
VANKAPLLAMLQERIGLLDGQLLLVRQKIKTLRGEEKTLEKEQRALLRLIELEEGKQDG